MAGFFTLAGLNFPWHYDRALSRHELEAARKYYEQPTVERSQARKQAGKSTIGPDMVAEAAAEDHDVLGMVRRCTDKYELADKAVLDIGSGRGYLQDVVNNYTRSRYLAQRHTALLQEVHFSGSAMVIPFEDNTFGAAGSI